MRRLALLSASSISVLLAGCAGNALNDTKKKVADAQVEAGMRTSAAEAKTSAGSGQIRVHDEAFSGSRAVLAEHGDVLPRSADHLFLGSMGAALRLREIASEIFAQTGIPVDVADEMPGAATAGGATQKQQQLASECRMAPSYDGKLEPFLENLSTMCDVNWVYRDGRLKISLFETETYRFYGLPTEAQIKTEMQSIGSTSSSGSGGGGGGQGGSGGVTASGQSVNNDLSVTGKLNVWDELKTILSSLAKPGFIEVSPANGEILVVARHSVQQSIKKMITAINRRQMRQVVFTVQLLNVTTSQEVDLGISLTAAYNQMHGEYLLNAVSPASLLTSSAGSVTVTAQNNTASGKTNPFKASNSVVSALQNIGNILNRKTISVSARDGRPAPVTIARQLGYISSATTSQSINTTQGGLVQSTLTIGLTLQLLPVILPDGRVLLHYSFGLSSLNAPLSQTQVTSNGITLQTPDVNVQSSMQEAVVRSGDAVVMLGYTDDSANQTDQGLPGLAESIFGVVGGSKTSTSSRSSLVVIITPEVQDSGGMAMK